MTAREVLRHLVDERSEVQTELARLWLEDLRHAGDEDGPPLDDQALASLDRRRCGGWREAAISIYYSSGVKLKPKVLPEMTTREALPEAHA